jgi:hypothetical protein
MEGRGFIALPSDADPTALFSRGHLTKLLDHLIEATADTSRAEEIAANLVREAEKSGVVEKAHLLTQEKSLEAPPRARQDVYLPVHGPYGSDVGLKWVLPDPTDEADDVMESFDLKFNKDSQVAPNPHRSTNDFDHYEKLSHPLANFKNADGAIDALQCLNWAVQQLEKRRMHHLANAVAALKDASARPFDGCIGGFKFFNLMSPVVVCAKPRIRSRREPYYKTAADTYKVEVTFVRLQTIVPPSKAHANNASWVAKPPKFYLSVCFTNDNTPRFNPRVVHQRFRKLAARWRALQDRQAPGQGQRVYFDNYARMVFIHGQQDLTGTLLAKL